MIDTRRLLEFDFTDKRVTVVGLGVEGVDMVRFLSRHHAEVTVSDSKTRERLAERLRDRAAHIRKLQWLDFETCMSCRMRAARLVVSMGGYNTLCELALHRTPALVIPRIATADYFIHFLVILPILGLVEKPKPRPESITKSVLDRIAQKSTPASSGKPPPGGAQTSEAGS